MQIFNALRYAWKGKQYISLVILTLFLAGCDVNEIPNLEEAAKASWTDVMNQYQRRADLVSELVSIAKATQNFEDQTLETIAKYHAKATQSLTDPEGFRNWDKVQELHNSQSALSDELLDFVAEVGRHPQLGVSENFRTLQARLAEVENQIRISRWNYIRAVQDYNDELRGIPGRWWASWLYPNKQPLASFSAARV